MPTNKKKPCPRCGTPCRATATMCRACQMKSRLRAAAVSDVPARLLPPAVVVCTCGHQIIHPSRTEAWAQMDKHCEATH